MNLIVESKRDQRVLDWLVSQVGEEAVVNACMHLAGARRAYVSNIAKLLNLSIPANLALMTKEDAQHHIEVIYRLLEARQRGDGGDGAA